MPQNTFKKYLLEIALIKNNQISNLMQQLQYNLGIEEKTGTPYLSITIGRTEKRYVGIIAEEYIQIEMGVDSWTLEYMLSKMTGTQILESLFNSDTKYYCLASSDILESAKFVNKTLDKWDNDCSIYEFTMANGLTGRGVLKSGLIRKLQLEGKEVEYEQSFYFKNGVNYSNIKIIIPKKKKSITKKIKSVAA